jgi:hypothetical protein
MLRAVMLCPVLCTLLAAGGAYGGEKMNVHASLTVEAKHEKVLVTFRIENRGERRVGLPRAIATDDEVSGRLFELREHPGGAEVAYVGKMVKRAALGADDYFELPPHSAHTHTIDITRAYAFKPGMHTYEIRYEGAALADVKQLESATGIRTEPVMFAHAEK